VRGSTWGRDAAGHPLMQTIDYLRGVRVFAGMPDDLLEHLAAEVNEVRFEAGDWVMREGDPAGSVYIVRSGRLDVIDEGPPETVVRTLQRGDVLGELALLREEERSASIRARRDVALLAIDREAFENLIDQAPGFALGLARSMGAQLAVSRAPLSIATPPRTIAVVGLDPAAPDTEVADGLAAALARYGPLADLTGGGIEAIDQADRRGERVLMRAGSATNDEWTALCVREAEMIVAVTTGRPSPAWLEDAVALDGCELLVCGPGIETKTLQRLAPRETQVVTAPSRRAAAVAATSRRLTGHSLGIVFSGGGARALAHLGVLEELRAAGLHFDRVAGVSLGSFVAATVAADYSMERMRELFEKAFVAANPSNDYAIPAYSLLRGAKARRMLNDAFGETRIEELPRRFFCLSCDLIGRREVVHRTGPIVDALYPSAALPGIFPPVVTDDGRLLVDGGVLDNLPVAMMARTGEGPVVAVDVSGRPGDFRRPSRSRLSRLGRPMRRVLTGSDGHMPRLGETLMRTVTVGSIDTFAAAHDNADLVILPEVEGIGLLDWKAFQRVLDLGRAAARDALDANPDLVSRLTS
jgi:NTE family protein